MESFRLMQSLSFRPFVSRRYFSSARSVIKDRFPNVVQRPFCRRRWVCAATPDPEQIRKLQDDMKAAFESNPEVTFYIPLCFTFVKTDEAENGHDARGYEKP